MPTPSPPNAAKPVLVLFALSLAAAAATLAIAYVWNRSGLPQMPFAGIVLIALLGTLAVRWFARRR